jgi:hypothetical protein
MAIKYRFMNWKFDAARWAEALNGHAHDDLAAARELSGLTASGWRNWMKGEQGKSYIHPGMMNFLNVCNLLDLDPRDFFTLEG